MQQITIKINKTFIEKGINVIPNDFALSILNNEGDLSLKKTYPISLKWNRENYSIFLRHAYRGNTDYWQLDWRSNKKLNIALKKEFIQSYIKTKCKELKVENDIFYGTDEAITIKCIAKQNIEFETFIKVKTPYDSFFKKLIDLNAFYFIDQTDNKNFIIKSNDWMPSSKLKDEPDQEFVVYYLIDTVNKLLYIGSAKHLKDRVKLGRSEIPNWNYFRYEVVNPAFAQYLRSIEYHSIMNFATFLNNKAKIKNIDCFSSYKLVNLDIKGKWLDY